MDTTSTKQTLRPLYTIVALIIVAAAAGAYEPTGFIWLKLMGGIMAGFFLVFSGLKILDVPGFAKGVAKYDLLAKHWKPWGYMYPFVELVLGLCYLVFPVNTELNIVTLVVMLFGAVGVAFKLAKREQFQCACLGTFINVPLTKITLVENLVMATMALFMLL